MAAQDASRKASGRQSDPDRGLGQDRGLSAIAGVVKAEVLPRLLAAHQARGRGETPECRSRPPVPDAAFIAAFGAALIAGDGPAVRSRIEQLRQGGMTAEAVCLQALTPAARYLGEEWDQDRCSFLEVTTGTALLHGVMNELRPAFQTRRASGSDRRRMLLFTSPGEQHRFGLSMLAEFFRKEGWDVALPNGTTIPRIAAIVASRPVDVVGFSAGSDRHLGSLAACIAALRASSRNPDVVIMVGGPVFLERPELVRKIGADATAASAETAVAQAEAQVQACQAAAHQAASSPRPDRQRAARARAKPRKSGVAPTPAAACGQGMSHAP